ncbi:MAG: hypothetical protein JNN07_05900 [Verrucomicrobiales bacterium]|nr:hypothetical protein [Verrucomicrobiales bacterium]
MKPDGKSTVEWTLQELLVRLNEVAPEEWVCHVHSRSDDQGERFLESNLSALFRHHETLWKVSLVRERYDSEQPWGTVDLIREEYWLRLQRLEPRGLEQAVLSGVPARRVFQVVHDRCRPYLVDEAVTLELCLEEPDAEANASLETAAESPTLDHLLAALGTLAPSDWSIRFLQRGGTIDFCQKLMTAETDRLQVTLGENFIPAVDVATEAAASIPHFELELRQANGTRIPHRLTQSEIEELYSNSKRQINRALKH